MVTTVWDIAVSDDVTISVWILWPHHACQKQFMSRASSPLNHSLCSFIHSASEQHSGCRVARVLNYPYHNHACTQNYPSTWQGIQTQGGQDSICLSHEHSGCLVHTHGRPCPSHHRQRKRERSSSWGTIWSQTLTPISPEMRSTNGARVRG